MIINQFVHLEILSDLYVEGLQTSDFRDIYLNRIAEKVNQYLSGCVPVDEKYIYMGHDKQKRKRKEKEKKRKK